MKLSALAREYVTNTVAAEFDDELNAALNAKKAYADACNSKYDKFQTELSKLRADTYAKLCKLADKCGMHFLDKVSGITLKLLYKSSNWGHDISRSQFAETAFDETGFSCPHDDDEGSNIAACEYARLCNAENAVRGKIRSAVQRALYEIEVHGRKNTLEQIIHDVVTRIKSEK